MEDRFEKELDEAVIDIDLENIQTNNSIFYIVSKRIIDYRFFGWTYIFITIVFNSCNTYKVGRS